MIKWIKKLFGRKRLECAHSYVKFDRSSKYEYICQHCMKKVRFSYNAECDKFEFKQMLLGNPVQTYSNFKYEYNKKQEEEKWLKEKAEIE